FARLLNQGMVVKETYRCPEHDWLYTEEVKDGACVHCGKPVAVGRTEKMSKSLKNTVEPLSLIEKYGADTVRIFSLFAAPPDSMLEWSDAGVEGAWRFLNRVYRMVEKFVAGGFSGKASAEVKQKTHATIKRVSEDVEAFKFNTAIAAIMELVNAIYSTPEVDREAVESVVRLLAPMAPHLGEELWRRLGHDESQMLVTHPWPTWDEATAAKKRIAYPVQVNGKLRGQLEAEPEAGKEAIESQARGLDSVKPWIDGKEVVKVVFVPGRLINFVVRA
ncbi:MAG TPA: class I tRNA ligase family protein, partial [Polyangia bacterium]